MKECTKCKEVKELSEFYKKKSTNDGYSSSCKNCIKEYYKNNKEKIKEYQKEYGKEYRLNNKEKIKEYQKEYGKEHYKKNKEKKKEYGKEHYKKNKEKKKEYVNEWRKKNKEKINEWRKKNKEKINEYKNEYIKNKRKEDVVFRISQNTSGLIRLSLKNKGYTKKSRTHQILGCDFETFSYWLDVVSFYKEDDKHIDHTIPVSLAETEEEIYLLNHYTNFQYLSPSENISKGNRYIRKDNLQRVLDHHPEPDKLQTIIDRSDISIK